MAKPFREKFLATIENINPFDFGSTEEVYKKKRKLGDYLQRMAPIMKQCIRDKFSLNVSTFEMVSSIIWD